MDITGQTWLYVSGLLERGVRVLNYVGTLDWSKSQTGLVLTLVCNYIGNEAWMEKLHWSGQEEYNVAKLERWTVDGEVAGEYKTAGILTVSLVCDSSDSSSSKYSVPATWCPWINPSTPRRSSTTGSTPVKSARRSNSPHG